MGVWVTWLMFRTSESARLIIAKIKPLSSKTLLILFLFSNILNFNERVLKRYIANVG